MNRLFGKKSKEAKPTLGDANAHIDTRSDAVDARVSRLDAELAKLKPLIQQSRGPMQQRYKQRAVQLLQQKRTYQRQQDGMRAQQFNMDQLQFAVQTMSDTQIQVQAMKDANKQLKKQIKHTNVDKVEDLQLDLAEQYYDVQEIQELMGRTYDVPEDIDEDEMLAELNAFDTEAGQGESDYIADALALPTPALPTAPVALPADGGGAAAHEGGETAGKQPNALSLEAQLGL